jgi:hypothetical protein
LRCCKIGGLLIYRASAQARAGRRRREVRLELIVAIADMLAMTLLATVALAIAVLPE